MSETIETPVLAIATDTADRIRKAFMASCCLTCRHWRVEVDRFDASQHQLIVDPDIWYAGECRIRAPDPMHGWPQTGHRDDCGEYTPHPIASEMRAHLSLGEIGNLTDNPVGVFLRDRTVKQVGWSVTMTDLYEGYLTWLFAVRPEAVAPSMPAFNAEMSRNGVASTKEDGRIRFSDVRLKP